MKLPKLYRKVWIKWELQDDYHVEFTYFQAYRVKKSDNTWFWKLVDESQTPSWWGLWENGDCVFESIIKKFPFQNNFYSYSTPSITEQKKQNEIHWLDPLPFLKQTGK